jgi:hypothetical protein
MLEDLSLRVLNQPGSAVDHETSARRLEGVILSGAASRSMCDIVTGVTPLPRSVVDDSEIPF